MRLSLRASGPAGAPTAWQRYADLDAWSAWSPQIDAVRTDGGARTLAAGLAGTVTGLPVAGRSLLAVRFTVEDVDAPATTWSWSVAPTRVLLDLPARFGRWAALRLEHEVLEVPGGSANRPAADRPCPGGAGLRAARPGGAATPGALSGRRQPPVTYPSAKSTCPTSPPSAAYPVSTNGGWSSPTAGNQP